MEVVVVDEQAADSIAINTGATVHRGGSHWSRSQSFILALCGEKSISSAKAARKAIRRLYRWTLRRLMVATMGGTDLFPTRRNKGTSCMKLYELVGVHEANHIFWCYSQHTVGSLTGCDERTNTKGNQAVQFVHKLTSSK